MEVRGAASAEELAAVLAALVAGGPAAPPVPTGLRGWRDARIAALRRTGDGPTERR